jgi:peptidoglycan-N-acetylglucosamine deacetylase
MTHFQHGVRTLIGIEEERMATQKDIQVCINPHFDAVALWIGSFGGADSPCDISRGVFGAKRGVPRLIEFFKRYGIITTWGVTGHSMESFPRAAEMIIKAGHEIGIHGYTHENPLAMSREQEAEVLDRTYEVIKSMSGKAPVGYMAPWWELSPNTVELLLARGMKYDSSMMEDDYHPYYLRVGDSWTKIDYSKKASEWMKPWKAGNEIDLVELPASWHLERRPPCSSRRFPTATAGSLGASSRKSGRINSIGSTGISITQSSPSPFIRIAPESRTSS